MSRRTVTRPELRVGGFWLSSIAKWSGLQHATRRTGSWELSFSLAVERTWRHPAIAYAAPVELMYGPVCLWSGALEEPNWDSGEMIALGAARDGETAVALTPDGASSTAPNIVLDAAIGNGGLSWSRLDDFGTTPVGEGEDVGGLVTIGSVLDAWAQREDSGWRVDPARRVRIAPTDESAPTWFVTPGSGVLGSASEERVDRISARYISSTSGQRATVHYPPPGPRARIQKPVDLTDRGAMTAATASDIAKGMWSDLAGRSGWTNGLTLTRGQVTTPGGVEVDLALVKGGDTMRLLGVPDPRGLAHNVDVVIGDTDYDWTDDELQANPVGLAPRDPVSALEAVGNLAVDAMARASRGSGSVAAPYATARGEVTVNLSASASGSTPITFPAGLFTVAPHVTVSLGSAVSAKVIPRAAVSSPTAATVFCFTGDGTAVTSTCTVYWEAVQMTPTSAGS